MADIPSLNLDFPDIGGDENSWGEILNEIMGTSASKSNDTTAIATVGGTTILSDTQELVGSIVVTGILAAAGILEFSGRTGTWLVSNETSGAYTLTVRIGAAGDTLEIARGKAQLVCCTGSAWIGTPAGGDFVPIDGSVPMTGNLALGTHKVTGLEPGTAATDAAALSQVGGALGQAVDMVVTVTANSSLSVSASSVTMYSIGLDLRTKRNVSLTLDPSVTGANGRDAGSEPTNAWMAVYVIYNPTTDTVAGLLSTDFSYGATWPSGYTFAARVGSVYNDVSGNLWRTTQRGKQGSFHVGTNPSSNNSLILGGGSTGGSPITADMTGFIPPSSAGVTIGLACVTDTYYVSLASDGVLWSGLIYQGTDVMDITIQSIASSIQYSSNDPNGQVKLLGWRET